MRTVCLCKVDKLDYVDCDSKLYTLVLIDRYNLLGVFLGRNDDVSIEEPHYFNTEVVWWWV